MPVECDGLVRGVIQQESGLDERPSGSADPAAQGSVEEQPRDIVGGARVIAVVDHRPTGARDQRGERNAFGDDDLGQLCAQPSMTTRENAS